jgi:membrane protease subunit HflK
MEDVLHEVNKVVVDKNVAGPGVLPYLPLPALKPGQPQTPPPPHPSQTTPGGGQ